MNKVTLQAYNIITVSDIFVSSFIMFIVFLFYVIFVTNISDTSIIHNLMIVLMYIAAILYLHLKAPTTLTAAISKRTHLKYLVVGNIIITILFIPYYFWLKNNNVSEVFLKLYEMNTVSKFAYLLIACFIIPLLEEILFRCYYYGIIKTKYGLVPGILVSVLLFAGMHIYQSANMLDILIQGIIYTVFFEISNSIKCSIILHMYNNSLWFLLTFLWS
ncbi:protease, Abi superfamily, putative [Geotalea daltonii FRC-32]|uniref:Protease, Abi superfamily, putative n=1 Tax=Geotalea daltonii (strain DSM 22248 / JCM 15807 / FRC-32) TaxID=316067 RepID=B9M6Z2_GEODF|nr:protease, Abi superfamily, putative [Geotalea daltonii FRC-32]